MTKMVPLVSCIFAAIIQVACGFSPHKTFLHQPSFESTNKGRLTRWMATVVDNVSELDEEAITHKTPIILLAGFLGTGKTSTLQHLLENMEGARIGVIVNDVASVNIDAKLVSSMPESASEDMIELQNGCACCSLSDELFESVETLFRPKRSGILGRKKEERKYDAIVVELSGVADPMAIAATWKAAGSTDQFPATELAEISKVVTMIDSCTFGTDYMTWDAAAQRPGWVQGGAGEGNRKVAELLAEQVEAANLILINKIDMATPEEVDIASKVARALNPRGALHAVEFGRISPQEILELGTQGVVTDPMQNTKDIKEAKEEPKPSCHDQASGSSCGKPSCSEETHNHNHSHEHAAESTCGSKTCKDTSCKDPDCTDTSHSHSHSHEHTSDDQACIDPGCTDTKHSHSHSHAHGTHVDDMGIVNFVYKSARPFNTNRLMALLNNWPVPVKDTLDLAELNEAQENGFNIIEDGLLDVRSPFVGVLRSKGFCWLAPTNWVGVNEDSYRHDTAMYWSHAGKHFGLGVNGKWWGSIQIFDGWQDYMKRLFKDNIAEYERILREDFVSEEFGDRRQELVFIGTNLDEAEITKSLDECLLTDAELETYRQELGNYQAAALSAPAVGGGLFEADRGGEQIEY